jgi:hypothetical protein
MSLGGPDDLQGCDLTTPLVRVDIVCINQKDMQERNDNVKRMRYIYQLASCVVVWLGPASNDSADALQSLEYIGSEVEYSQDDFLLPAPDCDHVEWHWRSCPLPWDGDRLCPAPSVSALLNRDWFDRVWTIQEISLANRKAMVQCGSDFIAWPLLRRAIICISSKTEDMDALGHLDKIEFTCRDLTIKTANYLLRLSRSRSCHDPRDKIYGILSIAAPQIADSIQPDYFLDPADIYKAYTSTEIALTHPLDDLSLGSSKSTLPGLPSWVPDWFDPAPEKNCGLSLNYQQESAPPR